MDFSNRFVSECREYSSYVQHVKAPVFRKSFVLKEGSQSGEILICGLGFYDLFINGEKITKGYLAPYISNTDHIVYYDHYDLTPWLKAGENVIGVMLGDGFQNSKTRVWDFITYKAAANATGYDVVLGTDSKKENGETRPYHYGDHKVLNLKEGTVTATFKNVPKGTWVVGMHAFNRTSEDGKKVFSPWSNLKKATVK